MAARLGCATSMVAKVGDDIFGKESIRNFEAAGVDTAHVSEVASTSTGAAQITVSESGDNCIIIVPGANGALVQADVERAHKLLEMCAVCVCQLEISREISAAALAFAKQAGAITILNAAPAQEDLPDELLCVSILCVNETESELLARGGQARPDVPFARVVENARMLQARGAQHVIVTLGAEGSVILQHGKEEPAHVPAAKVEHTVDTTGAGDCYVGTLAAALANGASLDKAVEAASAAAALSVQKRGTQKSYPALSDLPKHICSIFS